MFKCKEFFIYCLFKIIRQTDKVNQRGKSNPHRDTFSIVGCYLCKLNINKKGAVKMLNKKKYFQPFYSIFLVQVKQRCTTAACAGRCSPPSARWTATCWSTRGSDPSHARSADRPSPPTATCIATAAPTASATRARATVPAGRPPLPPWPRRAASGRGSARRLRPLHCLRQRRRSCSIRSKLQRRRRPLQCPQYHRRQCTVVSWLR